MEPRGSVYMVDIAKAVGHAMDRTSSGGYHCCKCGHWVANGTVENLTTFGVCPGRTPRELLS